MTTHAHFTYRIDIWSKPNGEQPHRVLINAQIAAGYALTARLRYPAIAIIMEHSDVLFDIHNAKNDA